MQFLFFALSSPFLLRKQALSGEIKGYFYEMEESSSNKWSVKEMYFCYILKIERIEILN